MGFKKIIFIGILLCIFMIGSACACENVTSDNSHDEMLSNVESQAISESQDDGLQLNGGEDDLAQVNDENILENPTGTEELHIDAKLDSEYVLNNYDYFFYVDIPKSVAKDVSIFIDGNLTDLKIDPVIEEEPLVEFNLLKLGLSAGKHNLTFSYPGNDKYAPTNKTYDLNVVNFKAFIPKTNWGDENRIMILLSDYSKGTITVIVDNVVKSKFNTEKYDFEDGISMPSVGYGTHDVEVKYDGILGSYSTKGKYVKSYIEIGIEEGSQNEWNDMWVNIFGEHGFSQQVTVKIAGKSFKVKVNHGDGSVTIPKSLLKIGKNKITLSYSGDKKFPAYSKTVVFNVIPKITPSNTVAFNDENECFVVDFPSGTKASYVFYEVTESPEGFNVFTQIKSGSVNSRIVYLPKLTVGSHILYFKYTTSDGFTYGDYFNVLVKKNTVGFKSGISKKTISFGKEVKVNIKSPKLKANAYIYVDGKKVKSLSLKKGTASAKVQILSQGKHKIKVYVRSGKNFYSKVYIVTVKKPTSLLTLKNVKVKKSAKKLVLKATLKKPNKKAISGKKVAFKFKGKTYKAKTNNKGVAKVTIKKSVLNKLKVGKTVNYQVTYQYTLKKSVKVKK